jgi:hypothetical protein
MSKKIQPKNQVVVFNDRKIRREFYENEWWFSIVDVVGTLSDSKNPRRYWSDLKIQLTEKEDFIQLYEKIVQLKLLSSDGKKYNSDCANTGTIFRII